MKKNKRIKILMRWYIFFDYYLKKCNEVKNLIKRYDLSLICILE